MSRSTEVTRRDLLQRTGLIAAGAGLWSDALFPNPAEADEKKSPAEAAVGRREILKGLDGMSRAADPGNDAFVCGHTAAAVISSAFFCREQKLDDEARKELLALLEARLLTKPIFEPREEDRAAPELVDGLVQDLDAGIDTLRRSGHNIIFAVVSLKALKAEPDAATPARVKGLRATVQSFGKSNGPGNRPKDKDGFADLGDEQKFVRFVFEEYLRALDLYLNGKGHHGMAGHLLTVGHALLELHRMGYKETAQKGVAAYWQFVEQARRGADLGGKKVQAPPPAPPTPLKRDYWVEQGKRRPGEIVSSHLVKYPYSFYALAKDLRDDALKQRLLEKLHHLTAVT
ncbi:MAG: hypothetical protein C0501_25700 [Isosphaera sp.]|nr:hypothetical protein [Isosphaera sp.]